MRDRIYIKDLKENTGREVIIAGWVDVRDMPGMVQCVALPSHAETIEQALGRSPMGEEKEIRPEWVLKITGKVNQRPDKNINAEILNGDLELEATSIEILN